jgi:hypothetical protein
MTVVTIVSNRHDGYLRDCTSSRTRLMGFCLGSSAVLRNYAWMLTELAAGAEFSPLATAGVVTAAED